MITKSKIIQIKNLADKRERVASGLFVAEGPKLVGELIVSDMRVREVYALPEVMDALPFFENVIEATPKEMDRISHLKTPSSVLAVVEMPRYDFDWKNVRNTLVLALDDIQDPGNLGTIIRLADWFGIRDIFCTAATADCFNPKVVQATMGAISRVRLHYTELEQWLSEASAQGMPLYGTFLEGENIYGAKLSSSGVIIMGNEGKGISPAIAERVTRKLYIPPYPADVPSGESLNAAIATAVICSEFRRRL